MKFKKGEKVEAVRASWGWGDIKKGDIGKIKDIEKDGTIIVNFPAHKGWIAKERDLVRSELSKLTSYQKSLRDKDKTYKAVLKDIKGLVKKYGQDSIRYSLNRWLTEQKEKKYWLKQREEAKKGLREIEKKLK